MRLRDEEILRQKNNPFENEDRKQTETLASLSNNLANFFALDLARKIGFQGAEKLYDAIAQVNMGNLRDKVLDPLMGIKKKRCPLPLAIFENALDWYCKWIFLNMGDGGSTSLSLAMALQQGPLEAMAREEGAEFLPLYHMFINQKDCLLGFCYVGNRQLYRDYIHKNPWGYFLWTQLIAAKVIELGWDKNTPANYTGLMDPSVFATPDELDSFVEANQPVNTAVQPGANDLLLLFCILGGCF